MKAVKRVEIIVPSAALEQVIGLLDSHKVPGYTVMQHVTGKGRRGVQDGEGLTTAFQNSYILLACSEAELQGLIEPMRKILHRCGGVVLSSDANWLIH